MTTQTSQPFEALEETTAIYGTTVQDEDGAGIAAASLTTLTLTLYNKDDTIKTIINTRDGQDVLNANNVTVDGSGVLEWTMQPNDNQIIGTSASVGGDEEHIALFQWTYSGGAKAGKHEVRILVKNLEKVT